MTFNFKAYLETQRDLINTHLKKLLNQFDSDRDLIQAMTHSLMAGGKRLRPILALAAAQACQKDTDFALPAGCAIEMIHTYSLIHDDLPAMDNDEVRRGIPTCHMQFSEAIALLAGDALLTQAFSLLSNPEPIFSRYPVADIRLKLISQIADASGTDGMVEGQMMDMLSYEGSDDDLLNHLKHIHALKTGKMIIVSVEAGAISVDADQQQVDSLVEYADKIGLAFQVVDDILNVEGDPDVMGKAAGSDLINDKMTFPAIIGLDQSKQYAKRLIDDALDSLSSFGRDAQPLRAIAEYIIHRKR